MAYPLSDILTFRSNGIIRGELAKINNNFISLLLSNYFKIIPNFDKNECWILVSKIMNVEFSFRKKNKTWSLDSKENERLHLISKYMNAKILFRKKWTLESRFKKKLIHERWKLVSKKRTLESRFIKNKWTLKFFEKYLKAEVSFRKKKERWSLVSKNKERWSLFSKKKHERWNQVSNKMNVRWSHVLEKTKSKKSV